MILPVTSSFSVGDSFHIPTLPVQSVNIQSTFASKLFHIVGVNGSQFETGVKAA
ncbi:MAG: hypothetical protein Q8S84_05850 [bacterium]|nr:hypothetical protein [bacterium]MDP3381004.1 hypothetical protein [bacterium]